MNSRVVLLEPLSNALDTSSLEEFGEVFVIFGNNNGIHQTPSVFKTQDYIEMIWDSLTKMNYDPRKDKFVLSGRLSKIAIATAALVRYFTDEQIKVLVYDGASSQYVERIL